MPHDGKVVHERREHDEEVEDLVRRQHEVEGAGQEALGHARRVQQGAADVERAHEEQVAEDHAHLLAHQPAVQHEVPDGDDATAADCRVTDCWWAG